MYDPRPIDTCCVPLPEELWELTELIAENVHDIWAIERLKEGWTYGEKRDDTAKTTPCLVPYAQLPDSEKEFDRNTVMQTIKLIMKLGYTIQRNKEYRRL